MPNIHDRFIDNVVASTRLDVALVPALDVASTKGPITAPVDLKYIAENIQTNLVDPQADTSHARPSMLAHVTSFSRNVRTAILKSSSVAAFAELDMQQRKDYAEWQGMIAAVALTQVLSATGLELSIKSEFLTRDRVLDRCILMSMTKGDGTFRPAVTMDGENEPISGYLYYICQAGEPFAIYHPTIGLVPMKTYDPTIFDGVLSWYHSDPKDCHNGWRLLVEPGRPSVLDDVCLSRIVWWAANNGLISFASFVARHQQNPEAVCDDSMAAPDVMPNALNIDSVWPGQGTKFGTAAAYTLDRSKVPMLFGERILVSFMGSSVQNKMIYNSVDGEKKVRFSGDIPELAAYAPVPPFRTESIALFRTCRIQELVFDGAVAAGKLSGIRVMLRVINGAGEVLTLRKYYSSQNICQGMVPYLMIWPYITLPEGRPELWKEFHATWHDQAGDGFNVLMRENGEAIAMAPDLTFNFGTQGQTDRIYRITKKSESWPVCTSKTPFSYAVVQDSAGGELGLVFIPKYKTCTMNVSNPMLSVDFGTTSTVCALQDTNLNNGMVTHLKFVDYSRTVTCEEEKAKRTVDVQHWMGNSGAGCNQPNDPEKRWYWDRKIFSVAQLFGRNEDGINNGASTVLNAGKQACWLDGRMFLASGAAMALFSGAGGGTDPLRSQKIMNDMKFVGKLDILNTHAATMYLAGIYTYAVLFMLDHGMIPSMIIRASYPNDVTLSALKKNWNYARNVLGSVMDESLTAPISSITFYNEATATAAYNLNSSRIQASTSSRITVDIGGGTTDISITNALRPDRDGELSFRYAGREMMVTSLIEYFRRFNSASSVERKQVFNNLWASSDTNTTLLLQFEEFCKLTEEQGSPDMFLRNLPDNTSLRMSMELLLADGMNMSSVDLDMDTPLLRQLITLKLLMVMRIVARCVHKNIDILRRPRDNRLDVDSGYLDLNLSISGASAQLIQYVFDCRINDLGGFKRADPPARPRDWGVWLLEQIFDLELKPVLNDREYTGVDSPVTTRLTIYVDGNVKEKREVCYGMLDEALDLLVGEGKPASPKAGSGPMNVANLLGAPVKGAQAVNSPSDGAAGKDDKMDEAKRREKVQAMTVNLMQYDHENLRKYLNGGFDEENNFYPGILNYLSAYEQAVFGGIPDSNRGLGDSVVKISDLLKEEMYSKHYVTGRNIMAKKRAAYMVENAQEDFRDLLACMYIVEELLNIEMAEQQLQ